MKTRKEWRKKKLVKKTTWLAATAAIMLMFSQHAFAETAANSTITNSVHVTWENQTGTASYFDDAVANVTVLLRPAAPTIDSPTGGDSAENTLYGLTYTITSNANGPDNYTLSTANGHDANLNPASLVVNGGAADTGDPVPGLAIPLGGTTLAATATVGQNQIIVPYDSDYDSNATSTNGITEGDIIIIGGLPYEVEVGGISEDAGTNETTITLTENLTVQGDIGDVVGERATFAVNVTTAELTSGASGNYTISTTASSATDAGETMTQATATVIRVRRPTLTIGKYVQVVNGPELVGPASASSYGPVDTGSGAGSRRYWTSIDAPPTAVLEYIIVVTNTDVIGSQATNVVIEDAIPQFTSYVLGSMRLDPDGSGFIALDDAIADAGETDGNNPVETIWIYAGNGGSDADIGPETGTGGTLAAGATTIGVFQVAIE